MPPDRLTVGVDVGGTKVLAGVVDGHGRVLDRRRRSTPVQSAAAVEDTIVDLVGSFRRDHDIVAVGVGAAALVDTHRAMVVFSPHLAWRDEPMQQALTDRLALPVMVDNDANTAALAEARFGAGAGHRFLVCVTIGTGVGGGIVLDGDLYHGAHGMAGELGHLQVVPDGRLCACGNRGCWEQYASGSTLVREARELLATDSPLAHGLRRRAEADPDGLSGPLITRAAQEGDALAGELLADLGRWLGVGLANIAAALDPGCIVVGGGVSEAGELLLGPTRAAFSRQLVGRGHRPEPPIVGAALGADAGFVGASVLPRG